MRTYPYTGWVLTPSFHVAERRFVRRMGGMAGVEADVPDRGAPYPVDAIFPTAAAAIADGFRRIADQVHALNLRISALDRKREQLHKALQGLRSQ
jgi:hypothetical protein